MLATRMWWPKQSRDAVDDVILVGHSLAGLTIPLVAAMRPVLRMVFPNAFIPIPGRPFSDQFGDEGAWHHHGQYETSLYVLEGAIRLEFGVNGAQAIEGGPGDIIHVPAGTVHREINIGDTLANTVLTRVGRGQSMLEVDGPQIG